VKGLQRRALKAAIAALAVVLVVLAVRALSSDGVVSLVNPDQSPADQVDSPDLPAEPPPDPEESQSNFDRVVGGAGVPETDGSAAAEPDPSASDPVIRSGIAGTPTESIALDDDSGPTAADPTGPEEPTAEESTSDGDTPDGQVAGPSAPAGTPATPEADPAPDPEPAPDPVPGVGSEPGVDPPPGADPSPGADPAPASADRFTVSGGSAVARTLDGGSGPVAQASHGTRIWCAVSHFAYGAPSGSGLPDASSAALYWGNTLAGPGASGSSVAGSGRSSCDGGSADRSAYWMPALFNSAGLAVLPERVLVEYKAFGGTGFDRSTIQAIPAGLHLVAGAQVANARAGDFRIERSGSLRIKLAFPSCLAVGPDGRPLLGPDPAGAHLSYPVVDGSGGSNGCPDSHPVRIPTLAYNVLYDVDPDSGWTLAPGSTSPTTGTLVAGAIVGWEASAADDLTRCVRDLLRCGFVEPDGAEAPADPGLRSGPDGTRWYRSTLALEDGVDRTPFGAALRPSCCS
jgi:hypothetical protein